jgi:hypothetical protein
MTPKLQERLTPELSSFCSLVAGLARRAQIGQRTVDAAAGPAAIAISNPLTPDKVIAVGGQKFPFPEMFFVKVAVGDPGIDLRICQTPHEGR